MLMSGGLLSSGDLVSMQINGFHHAKNNNSWSQHDQFYNIKGNKKMKKSFLIILLAVFVTSCASQSVSVDEDKMKNIKNVAVIIFTMKAKIAYRDNPKEDDSDLGAWGANSTAFGIGENAANLALPEFLNELNNQNLPFKVMALEEMKKNSAYMALQPPAPASPRTKKTMKTALSALKTNRAATGATGFVNFGLPKKWKSNGKALTGKKGEAEYIKKAIDALGVDAALVIVDRGTSFQCRLACALGSGDATMGGAFNAALIGKDGSTIIAANNWFNGKAHAVMARYVVNPLQREKLYTQHGVRMAQVFADTYREHAKPKKS